jgi:hypothetical protein
MHALYIFECIFAKRIPMSRSKTPLQTMVGVDFKRETIPVSVVGMNQVKVPQMLDRVGYQ